MRTRLVGAVAVLAITLGALAFPSAEPALAGSSCTGWTSKLVPPTSIRVYRTAKGRTVKVPFRIYVETVMASEWGPTHPIASLRVGAVAVKQFAWYYAMNWRGGRDAAGRCYDVVDTSRDQVYNPSKTISARHRAAVASTWGVSLRKGSRFFLTGYRAGTGSCRANRDGWKLYQRDATDCVRRNGWTAERLARHFYSSVSWITPGVGDWTGDARGDVAVISTDPEDGTTTGEVLTTHASYQAAVADGTSADTALTTVAADDLHGRAAADVTGDGRRDLVQLVATEDGAALQVIRATSSGFAPAATWWTDAADGTDVGTGDLRLVATDFTGDGRDDAAIVRVVGGEAPTTQVYVATSTGSRFASLRRTWSSAVNLSASDLLAGDVNGDGLGDLIAITPTSGGGSAIRVARARTKSALGGMATWGADELPPSALRPMVGDVNRDGRSDVIVARPSGDGVRILAYRSPASGTAFSRAFMTGTLAMPFAATRFSSADINADGRADVYALVDRGANADGISLGTDVWRLLANGSGTLGATRWLTAAPLDWGTAIPY